MKTVILNECGFDEAMLGLSLNKKQPVENMPKVALKLGSLDLAHNKFLESIVVWLDITAPRFFWSEFDTYRVGVTKQSESTMHTLKKEKLDNSNFEYPVSEYTINAINNAIKFDYPIEHIKNSLPDGFLQRRIVTTNYKTLRNIIKQRSHHKLPQWKEFCEYLKNNLKYGVYAGIEDIKND